MERDYLPTARVETLKQRAVIVDRVRSFFRENGYWEVDTPALSRDVCVDRWLEPIVVPAGEIGMPEMYLQTSPEFAMKRLITAGADAIFQIAHAFRREERGPKHNPEFAMLEWYRVGATYQEQMTFVERLVRAIGEVAVEGRCAEISSAISRITYDQAFEAAYGCRVLSLTAGELMTLAREHSVPVPDSLPEDDRDGLLNVLLAGKVEPWLARQGAVFLLDYPASQSALASVREDDPPVAERYELYLDGVEICNGYQELTDAAEFSRRMEKQAKLRAQSGLRPLPTESRLAEAMKAGFPKCSGVALGLDRLVMWRLGAERIEDVIAFPVERA
jgi:lysyl-tRNA synthetase class 2